MKLTAEDESDLEGRWEYVNEGGMNMILRYKGPTKDRDVIASSMLGSQVSILVVRLMMPMGAPVPVIVYWWLLWVPFFFMSRWNSLLQADIFTLRCSLPLRLLKSHGAK